MTLWIKTLILIEQTFFPQKQPYQIFVESTFVFVEIHLYQNNVGILVLVYSYDCEILLPQRSRQLYIQIKSFLLLNTYLQLKLCYPEILLIYQIQISGMQQKN